MNNIAGALVWDGWMMFGWSINYFILIFLILREFACSENKVYNLEFNLEKKYILCQKKNAEINLNLILMQNEFLGRMGNARREVKCFLEWREWVFVLTFGYQRREELEGNVIRINNKVYHYWYNKFYEFCKRRLKTTQHIRLLKM